MAEDLVAFFLSFRCLVIISLLHGAAAFLALSMLVKLFFEFVSSCNFIGYVSGDGTLNIIELAQAIESDHTLTVLISLSLSGSRLALLLLLEHLVLSEDVRLA